ncbi:aspartyl-tRNA synthetase cytoplasmic [Hysterangium stoloniferum]|nr:aspartyl-tRNA synthetase cytoplasmic [Hysterangium stoloniferum]
MATDREQAERKAKEEVQARRRDAYEKDERKANYGDLPEGGGGILEPLESLAEKKEGETIKFRARIHHSRVIGRKIMFLVFRQQLTIVQGVVTEQSGIVSESMVRWAGYLHPETIVYVEGVLQAPQDGQEEVKSATIHHLEVNVHKMYVVAKPTVLLPFQVIDASPSTALLENLEKTLTSHAIFRIHSGVTKLFRNSMDQQSFIEINSSKFQGSVTESGAAVFKVDYFNRPVYLAQSPQLAKQMCISADMERVYEVGPVFRAENSNTHRHLTEFTGLDFEMTINIDYTEVIDVIDATLQHIFLSLQSQYHEEIEIVKKQFPHDDLVFPEKTVRLPFKDGIKMLKDSGWKQEDGSELGEYDDLSSRSEQRLGALVKEKYNTDYYILDKFPLSARPFYTMPDADDEEYSNSFDIFVRGEEILSGGQRIHHAPLLEKRMQDARIRVDSMKEYVDAFRWGCPPHGGGGLGLERLVMLFLNLRDVRLACLFGRDPRSFSYPGQDSKAVLAETAQTAIVGGPRATTRKNNRGNGLPPVEHFIAKYGDATNTSWVDPAWTIWRHEPSGAAVGYIPEDGYAVAFGNPLCEPDQIAKVVRAFLDHIKREKHLKPVWCCVSKETEHHLANDLGWSAVVVVAEERLNPTEAVSGQDKNLRKKVHRAEREGVHLHEITGEPSDDFKEKVDARIKEWKDNRSGTQIHLTGVRPFDDLKHRRYFYATDKESHICCLVVLAQLAAAHGLQIKWALEFPGAPPGAIEYIITDVIDKLGEAGVETATFGVGALDQIRKADNVGGFRFMMLEKAYAGVAHAFPLMAKVDFRQKFGTYRDPLYICYPKGSIGVKGINTIMSVLQKPK